jgi:hypothetical protein
MLPWPTRWASSDRGSPIARRSRSTLAHGRRGAVDGPKEFGIGVAELQPRGSRSGAVCRRDAVHQRSRPCDHRLGRQRPQATSLRMGSCRKNARHDGPLIIEGEQAHYMFDRPTTKGYLPNRDRSDTAPSRDRRYVAVSRPVSFRPPASAGRVLSHLGRDDVEAGLARADHPHRHRLAAFGLPLRGY